MVRLNSSIHNCFSNGTEVLILENHFENFFATLISLVNTANDSVPDNSSPVVIDDQFFLLGYLNSGFSCPDEKQIIS